LDNLNVAAHALRLVNDPTLFIPNNFLVLAIIDVSLYSLFVNGFALSGGFDNTVPFLIHGEIDKVGILKPKRSNLKQISG
jgi:hypothetical protein